MATFPSRPVSRKRNSSTDEVAKANSNTVAGSRVPGYRPLAAQEQLHGQTPYTPAGNPIGDNQNSITADANRPVPLQDYHLIEKLAHQNPERTVHAKDWGAFSTLTTTADISKYTKTSNLVERIMKTIPKITTASAVAFSALVFTATPIRRTTMTLFKTLIAAALVSMIAVTSASAQSPSWPGPWWPDVFDALYPDRDLLNGGALTPAGRMGLELPGGAAPASGANNAYAAANAYAGMGSVGPSFRARRHRSYDHATDSFLGYDGRRHPSR